MVFESVHRLKRNKLYMFISCNSGKSGTWSFFRNLTMFGSGQVSSQILSGICYLWSQNKFSPNADLALAPAGFEFLNLARSGFGGICNSQIWYSPNQMSVDVLLSSLEWHCWLIVIVAVVCYHRTGMWRCAQLIRNALRSLVTQVTGVHSILHFSLFVR